MGSTCFLEYSLGKNTNPMHTRNTDTKKNKKNKPVPKNIPVPNKYFKFFYELI